MPWGFCDFPLFISRGNCTAKVCSLVLALSAKAWNAFFPPYLFSEIKHLCKWDISAFHLPCVLTTNVWLLTASLLLAWSFCSGCLHSPVLSVQWWWGRRTPSTEYLHGPAFHIIRMRISITEMWVLDHRPQSPWIISYIKSPVTSLKATLMYLISKEALKDSVRLSIYLFHEFSFVQRNRLLWCEIMRDLVSLGISAGSYPPWASF